MTGALSLYAITTGTRDHGSAFVIREHRIFAGSESAAPPRGFRRGSTPGVFVALEPTAIARTLDEARARVPPGLVCIARSPGDDPVIVESWL